MASRQKETAPEEGPKHPHYVKKALRRLECGTLLVRQISDTEEGAKGEGFVYFTHPDGRAFPTVSGAYCVSKGLVAPAGDGLFEGLSQTFRLP